MPIDKDRVEGAMKQMKGRAKEAAGHLTGDQKLKNEGRADKAKGKLQNFIGGIRDTLRGKRT